MNSSRFLILSLSSDKIIVCRSYSRLIVFLLLALGSRIVTVKNIIYLHISLIAKLINTTSSTELSFGFVDQSAIYVCSKGFSTGRLTQFGVDFFKLHECVKKIAILPEALQANEREHAGLCTLHGLGAGPDARLSSDARVLEIPYIMGSTLSKYVDISPKVIELASKMIISDKLTFIHNVLSYHSSEIEQLRKLTKLPNVEKLNLCRGEVSLTVGHGDFAPWNIIEGNINELYCVDLEYYTDQTLPLVDLLHYFLKREILIKKSKISLRIILEEFRAEKYNIYFEKAGLRKIISQNLEAYVLICLILIASARLKQLSSSEQCDDTFLNPILNILSSADENFYL